MVPSIVHTLISILSRFGSQFHKYHLQDIHPGQVERIQSLADEISGMGDHEYGEICFLLAQHTH